MESSQYVKVVTIANLIRVDKIRAESELLLAQAEAAADGGEVTADAVGKSILDISQTKGLSP